MKWSPSLSVGDTRIDGQHQQLFQLLESIEDDSVPIRPLADNAVGRFGSPPPRDSGTGAGLCTASPGADSNAIIEWPSQRNNGDRRRSFGAKWPAATGELTGWNDSAAASKVRAYAAVSSLQGYVLAHLRDEEAVMRSFRYKDYDAHCRHHHDFEMRLTLLTGRLTAEDPFIVLQELKVFVQSWLFNHISVVDQRYKPYLLS